MSHLFSILNRKARKPSFLKVLAVSRVFEKREGRLSMQQKKRYLFAISLVTAALFVLGVISWSNPQNRGIKAASSDYSITFDKATNKIGTDKFVSPSTVYSGSGFATTGLGNKIGFAYSSFANPTTVWQLIKGGGYFTNTDPIHGMKSITFTKANGSTGLQIYWSLDTTFSETNSATYDTTSALTFTCDFSGYAPNYVKVLALGTGNDAITSGSILFSCDNQYPTLTLAQNIASAGTVSGGGIHKIGSSVTLTATPNSGYKFAGWYHGTELLSTDTSYTFAMPTCVNDYVIEGRFVQDYFAVALSSQDTAQGSVSGSGSYQRGSSVTITATPASGYSFAGWYDGTTLVSSVNPYVFTMPESDLSYEARFTANSYKVSLASSEVATNPAGTCEVFGAGTYACGSSATISATPAVGYGFLGWYDGSTLISSNNSYTFAIPAKDISYVAKYSKKYHVSVASYDKTKGTVSGAGDFAYTSSVTVTGTPVVASPFNTITWYDDTFATVSTDFSYTFAMPESDVNLSAEFEKPTALGASFTFGKYPQTVVEDSTTLAALALATDDDSDGYLEYGSDEYEKVTGAPAGSSFKSASGNVTFTKGATYYFKVEPIEWRVLSGKGTATGLVMAEKILDKSCYYPNFNINRTISGSTVYPNNYQYSTLRAMLNGYDGSAYSVANFAGKGFLDVAFTEAEKTCITTTVVGNRSATTESFPNTYACADTSDKIFALSYQDLINTSYGFDSTTESSSTRCGVLTDYARATGVSMWTDSSYYGDGLWWSRSPNTYSSNYAWEVRSDGYFYQGDVSRASYGVRPCFNVSVG
jgi:uncharacterized repeat protein (TIGR02543 family)